MPAAHSGLISHIVERPKYQLVIAASFASRTLWNHTKQALYLTFYCIFGKCPQQKRLSPFVLTLKDSIARAAANFNPTRC